MTAIVRAGIAAGLMLATSGASAQSLGVFRWQLQPFCNVITVEVTAVQGVYRLTGFDDQCGAARRGSVTGVASINRDGSIGLALLGIGAPGGVGVSTAATISLATLAGTWRDGLGRSGAFAPPPPGQAGGSPRPFPPPGSLTTLQTGSGVGGWIAGDTLSVSLRFAGDGTSDQAAHADHTHSLANPTSTGVGVGALALGGGTFDNTAAGNAALGRSPSASNVARNTAVGVQALAWSGADTTFNVAVGLAALTGLRTGTDNIAVGPGALSASTSAQLNIGVGRGALNRSTGMENIGIGQDALNPNQTGEGNIAIGSLAGSLAGPAGRENVYIRNSGSANDIATIRIGPDNQQRTYIAGVAGRQSVGGVPVLVNSFGRLGTVMSSARTKDGIAPIGNAAARLFDLKPVQFTYATEIGGDPSEVQYGLLAEEVAAAFPELAILDEQGRPTGVRYHLLAPLLLGEVQRLQAEFAALEEREREYARWAVQLAAGRAIGLEKKP